MTKQLNWKILYRGESDNGTGYVVVAIKSARLAARIRELGSNAQPVRSWAKNVDVSSISTEHDHQQFDDVDGDLVKLVLLYL